MQRFGVRDEGETGAYNCLTLYTLSPAPDAGPFFDTTGRPLAPPHRYQPRPRVNSGPSSKKSPVSWKGRGEVIWVMISGRIPVFRTKAILIAVIGSKKSRPGSGGSGSSFDEGQRPSHGPWCNHQYHRDCEHQTQQTE